MLFRSKGSIRQETVYIYDIYIYTYINIDMCVIYYIDEKNKKEIRRIYK